MSKGQTLRALVQERLAAAAEDIFVLFERTIAEYEEENHRKQTILDQLLSPRKIQVPSISLGTGPSPFPGRGLDPGHSSDPCLSSKVSQIERVKEELEEQSVKQEELLTEAVPECSGVCVKTEESSLLQLQTEEDISSEKHSPHTDWRASFSCSVTQMETEADGDHHPQVHTRDTSAPLTSVHSGDKGKTLQCPFCQKNFLRKENLERHVRVHTGEKPYSCSVCEKTFADQSTFRRHNKVVHAGEKTFICSVCNKTFAHKYTLEYHRRTHTGEKPYSCEACEETFADHSTFKRHIRTHTGEKPFSCSVCEKTFARKDNLRTHMSIHNL